MRASAASLVVLPTLLNKRRSLEGEGRRVCVGDTHCLLGYFLLFGASRVSIVGAALRVLTLFEAGAIVRLCFDRLRSEEECNGIRKETLKLYLWWFWWMI